MAGSNITGREPQLIGVGGKKHERRLSLRGVATMLNLLPPEAVALEAVEAALRSEEFFVRYNAGKLLARRGDRDARQVIERVLAEGDGPSRATAARHLYGFSWFAAEPLLRRALKDSDSRVREGAVYALCDLRELSAYQLLLQTLTGEQDNVLEAATWGLRDCQDSAAVPVLELVLKSAHDPDVRVKALEALGTNDTPEAMPVVRQAMNDPEPDVKYAATLSLLELAGESWLGELSGIIGRTKGETLHQVLRGFFHATNYLKIDVSHSAAADLMVDALETALMDDAAAVRKAVVWPLAWMRHPRTPGIIRRTYTAERDPEVKAHIVKVVTSLMNATAGGDAESQQVALGILEDALNSPHAPVRLAAEQVVQDRVQRAEVQGGTPALN